MTSTAHALPLASCIMPTCNRRHFVPQAIRYFQRQQYEPKELIVVDDGDEPVEDLVPNDARIRLIRLAERTRIGTKRNLACKEARGTYILHWDDDDWMADWRITYQVEQIRQLRADICGLRRGAVFRSGCGSILGVHLSRHDQTVGVWCLALLHRRILAE